MDREFGDLIVRLDGSEIGRFELSALVAELREATPDGPVAAGALPRSMTSRGYRLALDVSSISGRVVNGVARIEHVSGTLIDVPEDG